MSRESEEGAPFKGWVEEKEAMKKHKKRAQREKRRVLCLRSPRKRVSQEIGRNYQCKILMGDQ